MKTKSFGTKKTPICTHASGNGAGCYKCTKRNKERCPFQKWCPKIYAYDFLMSEAKQNCKDFTL